MMGLGKELYEGKYPLLRKLASLPLVKQAIRAFISPSRRLARKIESLRKFKEAHGASDIHLVGHHVVIELEDGFKSYFIPELSMLALYQENERASLKAVLDRLDNGKVFLDIGAHIGWYGIQAAKKGVETHCFEPVPRTRQILERNAEVNGVSLEVSGDAVGERKGHTFITIDHFGQNHLTSSEQAKRTKVITLDAYVHKRGLSVGFIKADIEGAELLMLRGATAILDEQAPPLLLEIERKHTERFGYIPADLFGFLRDKGYRCKAVFNGPKKYAFKGGLEQNLRKGNNFLFERDD